MLTLRSTLLCGHGFRHGFSLRTGGVSAPPFDSLNLARNLGDAPQAVAENHRRLALHVGYAEERLYEVSQVHGARVEAVDTHVVPSEFRAREGDALVVCERGWAVGVRVADCVPVLLADEASGAVAAVHAGWRGTVAGVVCAGVRALCERAGAAPARLIAAVGPHIGVNAFEVSQDVAQRVAESAGQAEGVVLRCEPRPHVSLELAVRAQLERAGLREERIDSVRGCTFSEPERFFSFRRDGTASGRHLAVIVAGC